MLEALVWDGAKYLYQSEATNANEAQDALRQRCRDMANNMPKINVRLHAFEEGLAPRFVECVIATAKHFAAVNTWMPAGCSLEIKPECKTTEKVGAANELWSKVKTTYGIHGAEAYGVKPPWGPGGDGENAALRLKTPVVLGPMPEGCKRSPGWRRISPTTRQASLRHS